MCWWSKLQYHMVSDTRSSGRFLHCCRYLQRSFRECRSLSASPQPSWIFCVCCMDIYRAYIRNASRKRIHRDVSSFITDNPNLPVPLHNNRIQHHCWWCTQSLKRFPVSWRKVFRRRSIFNSADKEHLELKGRMHIPAGCPAHPPVDTSEDVKTALLARSRSSRWTV